MNNSNIASEAGKATFFALTEHKTDLNVIVLNSRVKSISEFEFSQTPSHIWCECRNLNITPKRLQGVIVAFSKRDNPGTFHLGIVIFMNFHYCLIAYNQRSHPTKLCVENSFPNIIHLDMNKDVHKIHYLNLVYGDYSTIKYDHISQSPARCNVDGKFQCKLQPDVVVTFDQFPITWKTISAKTRNKDRECTLTHNAPTSHKRKKTETIKEEMNDHMTYIKVTKHIQSPLELSTPDTCGYFYVPYVSEGYNVNEHISLPWMHQQNFGLLSLPSVKLLLEKKTIY